MFSSRILWRPVGRLTPTFLFPVFWTGDDYDSDKLNTQHLYPQTGWDRVKLMYTLNEYHETSVELHTVAQSTLTGFLFGALMGGFVKSRHAYLYFIENNQATIFKSTKSAQKKLQDYVTIAFAKGAYTWGWRLGTFTGIFSLIATTISVYRGDTSIVEYVTAGTLTGAVYRCHLGLAATIVGAGLGATLSLIAGSAVVLILRATGVNMDDIRKSLYRIKEARYDQYKEAVEQASDIKNDPLILHHDAVVKEKGANSVADINY